MGRRERFSQYQWAAWPDEGLLEAAGQLHMPYVTRLEQCPRGGLALVVELEGEYFADAAQAESRDGPHGAGGVRPRRTLRLTWEGSREHIFFMEVYDEFYVGPFLSCGPHGQGVNSPGLYEVVNDPDPWVMEILRENRNTDVFPPYAPTVLEYHRDTDTFSGGGRFAEVDEARGAVYFWSGDARPIPGQQARLEATIKRGSVAQAALERSRPRYRHLFIASESVMVEILCEGLPRWEWVDVSQDA